MELHNVRREKKFRSNSRSNPSDNPFRSFRNSRDDKRGEYTNVTCSDCGTECRVPFVPRNDRPVYCSDCFRQNKPQDSGNDRYSRDDRGSRYSRDDRGSKYSRDDKRGESTTVTCADCGTECQVPFVPRNDKPVYCSDCFRKNKPQDSGNDRYSRDDRGSRYSKDDRGSRYSRDDRGSRYSRDDRQVESTTVTCADCGTECQVPFVPRNDKPVYCSDCFRKNKPQDSGNDRYSSDDRGSRRSNYRDSRSSRDDFRSKSTKIKSLKKQETFYSGGSDKFYNTLKEKLFEILGGKVCTSCGFKDERALGISHNVETDSFDSVRRGGSASSWGKYISDPDLARSELTILCLNCNELKTPISPPKEKTKDFKKKKNRFPR